jgi:hypothetical protein
VTVRSMTANATAVLTSFLMLLSCVVWALLQG